MITSTNHRMVTPPHHPHHWFQREFLLLQSHGSTSSPPSLPQSPYHAAMERKQFSELAVPVV